MSIKRWIVEDNKEKSQSLSQQTNLPQLVSSVLVARGLTTPEQVTDFLSDDIEYESPFAIKDMDKAVDRINKALENGEKIAIYGDYDCDGITSTALLISYFQSVGGDAFYYIPDRESEGYGLNKKAIDKLKAFGTNLIITVDNGVTSHEEIAHANALGLDVVVTDHHTPRETLPPAVAVVNPHRPDCPSKFKDYAGVGVAFKLVCALEGAETWEMLELYADLVTIGTIADIVPLVGENRAIVQFGLESLPHSVRPGIHALFGIAGISEDEPITSDSIAFGLAPRINAAGRMGEVEDAVELLITDDMEFAEETAEKLQGYNQKRRSIEDEILEEVSQVLADNPEILKERVLIVSGPDWHPGVMGIVASRLLDQYGKPCFVFSVSGGEASGSGRSLEGFDLIQAVHACSEKLLHYGGHTMAAGATVPAKDLSYFAQQMQQYAAEHYEVMPVPSIHASAWLEGDDLTLENVKTLEMLGPFGAENEAPLFALHGVQITGIFPTRDGNHMRLRLKAQEQEFTAIYFRMPEEQFPYVVSDTVDCVVALEVNFWNGAQQLSVCIEDLRRTGLPQDDIIKQRELYQRHVRGEYKEEQKNALLPGREHLALVYRYLRHEEGFPYGEMALFERFLEQDITFGKMCIALDAFEELGLITKENGAIQVVPTQEKVDLADSQVLKNLKNLQNLKS